jgi:hypothetical protein
MSIQKKSLINTLKTTKKANIAKEDFSVSDTTASPVFKHAVRKDLVTKNAVRKDLATKQLVRKDLVTKNLVRKDLVTKNLVSKNLVRK